LPRCPEIQKLVKQLEDEKEATEEKVKKYIESAVATIMRLKNIKPELHRQ
jgi:hypothetical protein